MKPFMAALAVLCATLFPAPSNAETARMSSQQKETFVKNIIASMVEGSPRFMCPAFVKRYGGSLNQCRQTVPEVLTVCNRRLIHELNGKPFNDRTEFEYTMALYRCAAGEYATLFNNKPNAFKDNASHRRGQANQKEAGGIING